MFFMVNRKGVLELSSRGTYILRSFRQNHLSFLLTFMSLTVGIIFLQLIRAGEITETTLMVKLDSCYQRFNCHSP